MSSPITQEMVILNVSPFFRCWRLVYDGTTKDVLDLRESVGYLKTKTQLFCSSPTDGVTEGSITSAGGKAECMAEIAALGLHYTPTP